MEKEIEEIVTAEEDIDKNDTENSNKEESREFYVYKHIRKDNNTCFYVGKGKGCRMYMPKRNKHFNRIRKKYGCYVVKIKENLTEKEAFALEREIIEDYVFVFGYGINIKGYYKGYNKNERLTNCTWGGEGTSGIIPWNKGKQLSDETKQKMSESHKCEKNGMWGKHHSKESKLKNSKSRKGKRTGENHPMYGKHYSEEHNKKISEVRRKKFKGENHPMYGKHHTEESKRKMSKVHEGKEMSEEHNQKISKKVVCITTGKIFDSIKKAGYHYGISPDTISTCCKGKRKSSGVLNHVPLQWKYLKDYNNEFKGILINPIIK